MELLAPAGNQEKLEFAAIYGADAIYIGGKEFGLRAQSKNFSRHEIKQALKYAHNNNVKIYVTLNIFAHNRHIDKLEEYISFLANNKVDAFIISDLGIFALAKEIAPAIPIHISTQANVTNWRSAAFWFKLGANRIILARELTITEVREIKQRVPDIEIEIFVHGAMCMAYSGRCLLSAYLNGRNANLGNCSQPCRWKYALVEETRPEEQFPLRENENGTYILNSKDLCLIKRIDEIKQIGVDSIKIEGRMKSLYYTANTTRVYKAALQNLFDNNEILEKELEKISHRVYTEGFFDKFDSLDTQYQAASAYIRKYQFLGFVTDISDKYCFIEVRAKFEVGDIIEFISPDINNDFKIKVKEILDENNEIINFTKPNTTVKMKLSHQIQRFAILRKQIDV